ncbi:MAG: hypothetical protein EOP46_02765 [Sphingobacteriaceae bacterium]|nr:MAG: hypothetical protein EOP46_02765 [Sphingobacteriaceae bacterium]
MMKLIKAIAFIGALLIVGCKDSYFADDDKLPGNEVANLDVSTMNYLENNRQSFDTLARLIKITGLETAVNAKGNTFLAPRDYSIHNFFKLLYPDPQNTPATLEDIPQADKELIADILKNYIIPNEEILRAKLATTYSYVTTYGGKKARFNIVAEDYLGNVNMGAKYIVFSLNMSDPGEREVYQSVRVATADLRSTNGTVHVLESDTHIFGFN